MSAAEERDIVASNSWDWMLFREPSGELELTVVCGSVGLFEVIVPFEQDVLEAEGMAGIERLVAEIRLQPERFLHPPKA